jgi:hypothetical protein
LARPGGGCRARRKAGSVISTTRSPSRKAVRWKRSPTGAAYILRLKKADQDSEPWRTAAEALLMASEGRGPIMHARIAMLRALNAGKPKSDPAPSPKHAKAYRIVR